MGMMTAIAAPFARPVPADDVSDARLSYDFDKFDSDSVGTEHVLSQGGIEYAAGQFLLSGDARAFVLSGVTKRRPH